MTAEELLDPKLQESLERHLMRRYGKGMNIKIPTVKDQEEEKDF